MSFGPIAALLAAGLLASPLTPEGKGPAFVFASAAQASQILGGRDAFVQGLSPFDRAARLKTDQTVSEQAFLDFVAAQAGSWSGPERERVQAALTELAPRLGALALPWPQSIYLIRSSGREEGNAPYTRMNAIILPASALAAGSRLQELLLHELFHILSRHNPGLKAKLYAAIGFRPCGKVVLPAGLQARKITNPDAPINDFCIRLSHAGSPVWAVPILLSSAEHYDALRVGEFFEYLQLQFLLVSAAAEPDFSSAAETSLAELPELTGFYEQVGRNTEYILHPEEILADNFALLMLGTNPPSPEITTRLREILKQAAAEPD
ncbi:MAG: hypothetical protein ACAI44_00475 [Candidatus Sericytochromatia bacterium]